jgi:Fur family ferric uptake transcriptional regulator
MHGKPWWHHRFKNHGIRLTQPREIVIGILHGTDDHLSASEVYIKAHKENPSIGLTTVYRTLDMLVQMGIVQKFDFGDGCARFELVNNPEGKGHHHHLVCLSCKKIIDYSEMMDEEKSFLKKIESQLEEKYDFNIIDHVIRFQGYCKSCKSKEM